MSCSESVVLPLAAAQSNSIVGISSCRPRVCRCCSSEDLTTTQCWHQDTAANRYNTQRSYPSPSTDCALVARAEAPHTLRSTCRFAVGAGYGSRIHEIQDDRQFGSWFFGSGDENISKKTMQNTRAKTNDAKTNCKRKCKKTIRNEMQKARTKKSKHTKMTEPFTLLFNHFSPFGPPCHKCWGCDARTQCSAVQCGRSPCLGDGLDGIDWTPMLVSNWLNAFQTQTLLWVVVGLQVSFEPVSFEQVSFWCLWNNFFGFQSCDAVLKQHCCSFPIREHQLRLLPEPPSF